MKKLLIMLSLVIIPNLILGQSESLNEEEYKSFVDSVNVNLKYQYGLIELLDGSAKLTVPDGYKYLNGKQSAFVLTEIWGNPPSETLGLLFPQNITPFSNDFTYVVEITYSEDGYIDDEDAQDLDYDDLLEEMQQDAKDINPERVELGYDPITLVGWASEPFYDKENKKLHWAKELKFGDVETNTLNYNIRILGRKGFITMNAIGDLDVLPLVKKDINNVLASVEFNTGSRYVDFNPEIDDIAAYGIGGLIAGKVLAKAGFFALILKFWKIIAVALVAFFKPIRNLFRKKNNESTKKNSTESVE